MKDLLIKENLYSFVPDPAVEMFEESALTWYFGNCEEGVTPYIFDDLLTKDAWAQHFLMWLHGDISEYHFASMEKTHLFDPYIFPVERDAWGTDDLDEAQDYYLDNYEMNEMFFYLDIKRLLDNHHMFYLDSYAGNVIRKKTRAINPPIKGVW